MTREQCVEAAVAAVWLLIRDKLLAGTPEAPFDLPQPGRELGGAPHLSGGGRLSAPSLPQEASCEA